jgi:tRNA(His) 5'-end guanylyltransferase
MTRPFDQDLADLMVDVTKFLVEQTQASVGYTESDEISLILDPFSKSRDESKQGNALENSEDTVKQFMFDGRLQKLTSVIAGLATSRFVIGAISLWPERVARMPPVFDCRVFEVPNREEAVDALVFREMDAIMNAVSMAARAYFPHSRLQGRSATVMKEMLLQEHGVNFNDYPARFRRGVYVRRQTFEKDLDAATLAKIPEGNRPTGPVMRSEIIALDLPPILRVANRVDVLLNGAEPVLDSSPSLFPPPTMA